MATATAERRRKSEAAASLDEIRNWPSQFAELPVDHLFVDGDYQRPLTDFAKKIQDEWDPTMVNVLICNKRKAGQNSYAVIDGQTRLAAAMARGVPKLPCLYFEGLTRPQEARLFARLQRERRNMTSYQRFRAALVADEPEARAIKEITDAVGYELGNEPGKIKAVGALEAVYRRDPVILERALIDIREAWGDETIPDAMVIRGMGYFLQRHPETDDEKLARRLKTVSMDQLRRRASALREGQGAGGGSDKYMAGAIEAEYQRRGRS